MSTWIVGFRSRCELLPEDTDEPERLELLDAAIPTGPDPTRPDPIQSEAGSLPLGQGALTASRAFRHRRCLHVSAHAGCLTSPTISCLAGRRVHRPSGSAARCPALCGEELPPPPPHAREEGGKGWMEGRCRIYSSGSAERRINTDRSGADPLTHPAQTGSAAPGLIVAQGSYGFHVPL